MCYYYFCATCAINHTALGLLFVTKSSNLFCTLSMQAFRRNCASSTVSPTVIGTSCLGDVDTSCAPLPTRFLLPGHHNGTLEWSSYHKLCTTVLSSKEPPIGILRRFSMVIENFNFVSKETKSNTVLIHLYVYIL